ncbi:MAG: signal peptide peptidase SppA [Candidatus Micrarchaeia archaeon]
MTARKEGFSILGIIAIILVVIVLSIVVLSIFGQLAGIVISKPCIAEIKVDFPITDVSEENNILFPEPRPTAKDVIKLIDEANERSDISAIVVYIDSPGGEIIATREIYENLKSSKKPVVAYLRNIATSGGYYAALGADYIVSEPETVTGSIGVRATFISFESLFRNFGINYTVISSGSMKDMGDIGRNLSDQERAVVKEYIEEIFQDFKDKVVENRKGRPNFSSSGLETVLDARIISGRKAYSLGLVDEIGNRKRAFEKAAELSNISEYNECTLTPTSSLLKMFMQEMLKPLNIRIEIPFYGFGENEKVKVTYS